MTGLTGYEHPKYALSLGEFGRPKHLHNCGGWILERDIPASAYKDGMGIYPLFICRDWSRIHADLDELADTLISFSLVTDPFGDFCHLDLYKQFNFVIDFKTHFVTDTSEPLTDIVSRHHQCYARKSLKKMKVIECKDPTSYFGEWVCLYKALIDRHDLKGIKSFSEESFRIQFGIPGFVMYCVEYDDEIVGAQLWFLRNNVAYSHLTAINDVGYRTRASYALQWDAMVSLSKKVRWLDLGAGAGLSDNLSDGLSVFKKGWTNKTRPAYFCGHVFDTEKYNELVIEKHLTSAKYFPAYRDGEFNK